MGHSFRIGYRILKVGTTPHRRARRGTMAMQARPYTGQVPPRHLPSIKTSFHIWAGRRLDDGLGVS